MSRGLRGVGGGSVCVDRTVGEYELVARVSNPYLSKSKSQVLLFENEHSS